MEGAIRSGELDFSFVLVTGDDVQKKERKMLAMPSPAYAPCHNTTP